MTRSQQALRRVDAARAGANRELQATLRGWPPGRDDPFPAAHGRPAGRNGSISRAHRFGPRSRARRASDFAGALVSPPAGRWTAKLAQSLPARELAPRCARAPAMRFSAELAYLRAGTAPVFHARAPAPHIPPAPARLRRPIPTHPRDCDAPPPRTFSPRLCASRRVASAAPGPRAAPPAPFIGPFPPLLPRSAARLFPGRARALDLSFPLRASTLTPVTTVFSSAP